MNRLCLKILFPLCLATILSFPLSLHAKQFSRANLAEIWLIDINYEDDQKFKQAFENYRNYRQSLGDYRPWEIYKAQISSVQDSYLLRHCCFKAVERDQYENWLNVEKVHEDWRNSMKSFVKSTQHFYSYTSPENISVNISFDNEQYVVVREFNLKNGSSARKAVSQLKNEIKNLDWGKYWAWDKNLGSKSLVNLDFSLENTSNTDIADITLPVDDVAKVLLDELSFKFDSYISDNRYDLYLYQEKLSR